MVFLSRLKLLFQLLFVKDIDFHIEGLQLKVNNGTLVVKGKYLIQNYDMHFTNCTKEEIEKAIIQKPSEFSEESLASCHLESQEVLNG